MTQRRDIERRRHSLGEIRDIMNSMKTLAYLETRKLARRVDPQQAVVTQIQTAASELLGAYPQLLAEADTGHSICVAVGSERGFCGNFNRSLVEQSTLHHRTHPDDHWIVVGRRLQSLWPQDMRTDAALDGASVAEELDAVRDAVVSAIVQLRARLGPGPLHVLTHPVDDGGPTWTQLLPPFQDLVPARATDSPPPQLHLPPRRMLLELADQYLFAALNARLLHALMAENHQRVRHLESATRHLDGQWQQLGRRASMLRQEEIIEEIEVILLSAAPGG